MEVKVELRRPGSSLIQTGMFDMPDNAHDLNTGPVRKRQDQSLSERIFMVKVLSRERLINDSYRRTVRCILREEPTPPQQLNSHRLKVLGTDGVTNRPCLVARFRR